jgi:hypothetical protein
MRVGSIAAGALALILSASAAAAQQPEMRSREQIQGPRRAMMMTMDSLNRRLDSLVSRMNSSSGNQKITAMAAVINELVAQRKAMQSHMHEMMDRPRRMVPRDSVQRDTTGPRGTGQPH